jgi:enoyl-CoA hydratase/carnithine racemase
MPNTNITIERRGPALWLTLSRPQIDAQAIRELRDACDSVRDDGDVRVVVLTGAGEAFATGWDDALLKAGVFDDPFGCLAELPKPVIAVINGDAIGGLALALAADIRIAADAARFGLPEADAGLLPMAGATQRLSRLVGRGKALELILTGETIDATEALRVGLVSEVVPASAVVSRAQEIAARIAERGPLALQYAKEAVSRGIDMPLEQALRFETDLTVILQTTEDRAEGVQAFIEKRKPKFKGR